MSDLRIIRVGREPDIAVCFCGMPYVPADPDVTHLVHYQCVFCRAEQLEESNEE